MMMTAAMRNTSGSKCSTRTRVDMDKVNMEKLDTTPRVMPSDRRCPPFSATEDERTIGRTGQMHGARIVTNPAKYANSSKEIIRFSTYDEDRLSGIVRPGQCKTYSGKIRPRLVSLYVIRAASRRSFWASSSESGFSNPKFITFGFI